MTTPTSIAADAASAAATGAVAAPFLAAFGIDLPAMLFGLLGAVIVQCLLPDATRSLKQIAGLTVGGMLLSGIATPLAMAYAANYFSQGPAQSVHNLAAAVVGGFAQPIVMRARAWVVRLLGARSGAATPPAKES